MRFFILCPHHIFVRTKSKHYPSSNKNSPEFSTGQNYGALGAGIVGLTDPVTQAVLARGRFIRRSERRLFGIQPEMRAFMPLGSSAVWITPRVSPILHIERISLQDLSPASWEKSLDESEQAFSWLHRGFSTACGPL